MNWIDPHLEGFLVIERRDARDVGGGDRHWAGNSGKTETFDVWWKIKILSLKAGSVSAFIEMLTIPKSENKENSSNVLYIR